MGFRLTSKLVLCLKVQSLIESLGVLFPKPRVAAKRCAILSSDEKSERNLKKKTNKMMKFQIIMQIIIGCIIFYFAVKTVLEKLSDKKKVSNNINSETEKTNDLKISSYSYRNFLIDFGTEFNYCKFYFSKNETYLFCRNTFPTDIYTSPYILKFKKDNNYSYFSKFIVTNFNLNGNSLNIQFQNKSLIGTKLTLNIVNISENDKLILNKYFNNYRNE